jgi:hypothetical protein
MAKLLKMIESVPTVPDSEITIEIIFDGDSQGYNELFDSELNRNSLKGNMLGIDISSDHIGAVACRNHVISKVSPLFGERCTDGVLYATDDMTFNQGAIENALKAFNEHFPDDDGVVGFVQEPNSFHPTGVALVGKKFLERYPDKQLFYPKYYHFACQEIYWLADKLGKFYQCKDAIITHKHPSANPELIDETHNEARLHKADDMTLMKDRQAKGLI